jgi:hypothetical protein
LGETDQTWSANGFFIWRQVFHVILFLWRLSWISNFSNVMPIKDYDREQWMIVCLQETGICTRIVISLYEKSHNLLFASIKSGNGAVKVGL